ncbi:MAG: hypothetical protein LKI88_00870 [Bifidobacterium sp.]|jgi:predicted  nucleic acid-binding Zn-ribbon protein|nr:hypothetical protein [Bifidobacterium sp.]MCI1864482.1 hypothetical protein [Bifidobacterium sp.]
MTDAPISPAVIAQQLADLKELMTQNGQAMNKRFDGVEKRLDGLESQELHEADISHVNHRIDDLKESTQKESADLHDDIDDLKETIWKAVGAAAGAAGLIVALFEWAIPLIIH